MEINTIMQYASYLLMAIGLLAFVVAVITQVIKELPGLINLPTSGVAFVVSLILCPVAVLILCAWLKQPIIWYYVFGAFIAAFVVYLVSTGGWDRFYEIWQRTKYKKGGGQ